MLEAFVCIRVDVDRQPDLAKQHGAKAMPDLRLLDPDGRELQKLLGFSSPARLAQECRAVLDRLAGKPASTVKPQATVRQVEVTDTAMQKSIAQAAAFLEQRATKGLTEGNGIAGLADAVLLALVCAGKTDGVTVKALAKETGAAPLTSTYQVAFQAMAMARLDAGSRRERLAECYAFLAENQLPDGTWSYGADRIATGDHSNTAYALLGIDACARAGIAVSPDLVRKAERAWLQTQNADGGWGYRKDREAESYASMTESGLSSLVLCHRLAAAADTASAIARGTAWLVAHAAITENHGSSYQQGRLLYHLYALERTGALLATERFGALEWYQGGAAYLLGTQRDDGSFDDGADMPAANTVFALLFLTRATTWK